MKNGDYILLVAPKEYPGKKYRNKYVYEHHLVWWQNTSSILPKGYTIHHRNKDRHDNRFENLELIHISTHAKVHCRKKQMALLVCEYCKKPFERDMRNVKNKPGQVNFYCCKQHSDKSQIKGK